MAAAALTLLSALPATAQKEEDLSELTADPVVKEVVTKKVYTYVEQMPRLPGGGGNSAIIEAIQKKVRYPTSALRSKVEGKVYASFTVLSDGRVSDPKIIKGIGSGCDEATLVAIRQLPRFEPGRQNGQAVAVSFTVPVTFRLGESASPSPGSSGELRDKSVATGYGSRPTAGPPDTLQVMSYARPTPQMPPSQRVLVSPTGEKLTRTTSYETPDFIERAVEQALVLPAEVQQDKVEGTVSVQYVVSASGIVRDVRVTQHLSAATDSAAVQAVRKLPRLVPGQQNGYPVAVRMGQRLEFFGPNHVYDYATQPPVFPAPGLQAYQRQHLRIPPVVKAENLEGQVSASFVVRADGSVADAQITRPMCVSCDAEVLRFLKSLPRYTPAQIKGHAVAVRQRMDISLPSSPVDKDSLTKVYTYAEQMPTLPGTPIYNGISQAVQRAVVLPAEVRTGDVAGKVFVSFTVGPRGSVYDLKVVKSISPACDAAALAAIRKLPHLEGGKQNGRGVAVSFTLPVTFAKPEATPPGK